MFEFKMIVLSNIDWYVVILQLFVEKVSLYLGNVYPGSDEFSTLSEPAVGVHEHRTDDPQRDCVELIDSRQHCRCLLRPRPVSA